MSFFDYAARRPILVTCLHCGWHGVEGGECDCERRDEELRIAAVLRQAEEDEENRF